MCWVVLRTYSYLSAGTSPTKKQRSEAYPNLPDELPSGTSFVFAKESTGPLLARFKVGDTVYQNLAQHSLRRLWDSVELIDQLLDPLRYKSVS